VDFRILEANAAFEAQTGFDRRILGLPSRQYAPCREERWVERFCHVALTGEALRFTDFNADTNRHYEVYCFSPEAGMFAILFRDVSSQVQMERQLRERESYLDQMINSLAGLIWTTTAEGQADFLSSQWLTYTGTTFESQLGFGWAAAVHPEDLERIQAQWQEVIAQRCAHTAEFRIRRHDGEYRWFVARSSPIFSGDGKFSGWFGICTDIHEMKELQQKLEDAQRRYNALFSSRDTGIAHLSVITDEQGRVVDHVFEDVNATWESVIGRRRDEVVGRRLLECFPDAEEHDPGVIQRYGQIALEGGELAREIYHPGSGIWLSVFVHSHVRGHFTLIFTDVTRQRVAEAALRQSEEVNRATFEQASVGMLQVGLGGQLLRSNRKLRDMLGYAEEELAGKPLSFLSYPPDVMEGRDKFCRLAEGQLGNCIIEKRYQRRDKSVIWVRIAATAVRDADTGCIGHIFGVIEDITERRRFEEEREHLLQEMRFTAEVSQRNRVQLETFFNQAALGMAVVDTSGHLTRVNRRFCEIAGYQEGELLGRSIQSIIHPDDVEESRQHTLELLQGKRQSSTVEKRFIRRSGELIWVSSTSSLALDASGQPQFYIRVVQDISSRKQLEQQVQQVQRELEFRVEQRTAELLRANEALQKSRLAAEEARLSAESANRAKTDFLATMSHEIRTPLNGVIGMTSLLLDSPLDAHQKKHAEVIRQSGESLLHLLNEFLEFAKIEAGQMRLEPLVFDLKQILNESLALMQLKAARKGLQLAAEIEAPQWLIGDGARLRQILLNFLSNAVKFTERGSVVLRARQVLQQEDPADRGPADRGAADRGAVGLRFEVEDTGIGVESEMLSRLFEPFTQADSSTTRRYEGAGLGLAICRRLTDLLGGRIGATTLPGRGSTFWVEIPFHLVPREEWPAEPEPRESPAPRPVDNRWRVLVVEDNPVNQLTAAAMLKRLGCRVDVVGNGKEAVDAMRQVSYRLVLMDCDMPVMDGFEATRQIRALEGAEADTPIVAMTANVLRGEKEKCLGVGMNDYLAKPVRLSELESMLDKWLPQEE
ncbi:MAG: putative Histidine kinase (modular protein), partial [Moraxellaceae bacterium]|nr:putative Histidine kinase (modular protein) [Moraxellaceae bacterium]